MIVDLTAKQLGVIEYALSHTVLSVSQSYRQNGTAGLDMTDREARHMISDLGANRELFQQLYRQAWAREMQAKEEGNNAKPKTS